MTTRARRGVKVIEWEPKFLQALSLHGIVIQAIKVCGASKSTVYTRRDKSPAFAVKWEEALEEAISNVELSVHSAAIQGDMQTARWLLSRRKPDVYGDKVSMEHTGKDGGAVILNVRWTEPEQS